MSASKWDARFAKATSPGEPAMVLQENLHLLPSSGLALDLASGLGANALRLAQQGLVTHAWDISSVGLAKLTQFAQDKQVTIHTRCIDLESTFSVDSNLFDSYLFDIIIVSNYLYRPLAKMILQQLKPNGLLFYETFTVDNDSSNGPSNPAFLLKRNELLTLFAPLSVISYREDMDCGDITRGWRNKAYLIAKK